MNLIKPAEIDWREGSCSGSVYSGQSDMNSLITKVGYVFGLEAFIIVLLYKIRCYKLYRQIVR